MLAPGRKIVSWHPGSHPDLLRAIVRIEELSFPAPWSAAAFLSEIEQEGAFVDLVLDRGRVLAFCCCRRLHDELHIMQIATDPPLRRQGLGALLIGHVLDRARRTGCRSLWLEVRRGNRPAIGLYLRHGFRQVGVRRAYYADNGEDAVLMSLELP